MKYLLDTHMFIWFIEDNPLLVKRLRIMIENEQNNIYLSMVSFYEMAIKLKIGKLTLNKSLRNYINEIKEYDITLLPISENHIISYERVPLIEDHRDPFDRLLIATALYENIAVITADKKFDYYLDLIDVIK